MDEKPIRFALTRFSLLSLLAFVTCCAIILGFMRPWAPIRPSARNFGMIKGGMNYQQVVARLGQPSDHVYRPFASGTVLMLMYYPKESVPTIQKITVVMDDGVVKET